MNKERDLEGLEAVEIAALQWNDEVLGGSGFVDWHPFQHPQLGPLEIGGWQRLLRNNAPPQLLEETGENMTRFLLAHAQAAPQLRADFHQVEQISDGVYRIAVAARNEGYLPTHVTEQALKMKTADPVQARICIGPNDKLLVGKNREEIGHLAGYGGRRKVEWIVRFAEQPSAQISVACPRAGTVRLDLADALTT